jgi:hypothetical protein
VLACIACLRASAPIYWDEFVWLWKSRLELQGWGSLRAASLDPHGGVFPPGYPLLWSLAPAWFAWPLRRAPLETAAIWPLLVALSIWMTALRGSMRDEGSSRLGLGAAAFLFATTPLLVVHLRSSYVDLSVGLLASSIALMNTNTSSRFSVAARVVPALLLVGAKDEGIAHLAAISCTAIVFSLAAQRKRSALEAGAVLMLGAVPFVAWRVLLARHGIRDTHHVLGACAFDDAHALTQAFASSPFDLETWGVLWALSSGAALVALFARDRKLAPTRMLVIALLAQTAFLLAGILCGPERVREFAFGGSVLHRVLVQLAPGAVAIVGCAAVARAPGE